MESFSDICKQWWSSRLVNPRTGYAIKLNGPTYKKLLNECGHVNNSHENYRGSPTPEQRGKRVKKYHVHTEYDPTSHPQSDYKTPSPLWPQNENNYKMPTSDPGHPLPKSKNRRYVPVVHPDPESFSAPEQNAKRLKISSARTPRPPQPEPHRQRVPPLPPSTSEYETEVITKWYMEFKLSFPMDNAAIYNTFNPNALPVSLREQMSRYKKVHNIVNDILKYMMNTAARSGLCNKNEFVNIVTQVGENYKKKNNVPMIIEAPTPRVQPYTVDTVINWYISVLDKFPLKKSALLKVHPDKLPAEFIQQPEHIRALSNDIFNELHPLIQSNPEGISEAEFLHIIMALRCEYSK
jgi:hypothetical protein